MKDSQRTLTGGSESQKPKAIWSGNPSRSCGKLGSAEGIPQSYANRPFMKKLTKIAIVMTAGLTFTSATIAGGLLSLDPGPVDFSGGFDGKATDDGRVLQLVPPGSHPWFVSSFFKASQY